MTQQTVYGQARESIIDALEDQHKKGLAGYGCELATFNGRDAYRDFCEEQADALMYATQLKQERDHFEATLAEALTVIARVETLALRAVRADHPVLLLARLFLQEHRHADG